MLPASKAGFTHPQNELIKNVPDTVIILVLTKFLLFISTQIIDITVLSVVSNYLMINLKL